jgi:hypothetical protein
MFKRQLSLYSLGLIGLNYNLKKILSKEAIIYLINSLKNLFILRDILIL